MMKTMSGGEGFPVMLTEELTIFLFSLPSLDAMVAYLFTFCICSVTRNVYVFETKLTRCMCKWLGIGGPQQVVSIISKVC